MGQYVSQLFGFVSLLTPSWGNVLTAHAACAIDVIRYDTNITGKYIIM